MALSIKPKKFYIFTGKGGVGKTTSALSFSKYLQDNGTNVIFMDIEGNSKESICKSLGIKYQRLELFKSLELYISIKLKSKMLASWITSTDFFKSIVNIVPGMSYLIYLGHIMDHLKNDTTLTIVLDSPSSGHAVMMLQSAFHYHEIFQKGLIFNDIEKMIKFSREADVVRINICTIATELAVDESNELEEKVQELGYNNITFLNQTFNQLFENEDCPEFIRNKIKLEDNFLKKKKLREIPFSLEEESIEIIKDLSKNCEVLL